MTTATVAIDALVKVGHDTFVAAGGALLPNIVWEKRSPFSYHNDLNSVYLYKFQGTTSSQGLGTIKTWRYPKIRVDVLTNAYADSESVFEALRSAWIVDYNYYFSGNGSVGQGYLRQTGGIKHLEIGESFTTPWDDRGLVFRRTADIIIEIGDA